MADEAFKRWLAVLIAIATLLVGVATLLQNQSGARAAVLTRASQEAAVRATGELTRGQQRVAYDRWGVLALNDEMYTLAVRNRALEADPLGKAYLEAQKQLQPLSPLLAGTYTKQDTTGYRSTTDFGKYEADTFIVSARLYDEQRSAYAQASNAWNAKSDAYVAVIAILAVSLFLFALGSTLSGVIRYLFIVVGIGISTVAFVWMVGTTLTQVHEIPEAALQKVAEGTGYGVVAADYVAPSNAEYYRHANEFWQKAIDTYNEAVQLDPQYANAYSQRGQARLQVQPAQTQEAVADYQKAIELGKREYSTYWNLGAALYWNGDYDKVEASSRAALELNDRICGPHLNIALAALAQGKPDVATSEFENALKRCDDVYQEAVARGERPPDSLWSSMQNSADQIDNLLCVLAKKHCYENRNLPKLSQFANQETVITTAENLRKRIKEALTALEFQGTTQVTPSGKRFDPFQFAYYIVDDKNAFINYAERDVFPYNTRVPDIDVLSNYHGMSQDDLVVWKVFRDGAEELGLRYFDKWNLQQDGPVVKRVNSWYVPSPGLYELEVYVNGDLVQSGAFTISTQSELLNPPPTNAKPDAPVAVGKLLYGENFDNNYANWWTGTAALEQEGDVDGALTLATRMQDRSFTVSCTLCGPFQNFYYEADTRFVSGPLDYGYGLAFRGTSDMTSTYTFSISGSGHYNVSKFQGGWTYVIPWTESAAIKKQGENKLGVECRGSACHFYINGQKVNSATDSSLSGQFIGVIVANTDVQAAFDNVRVWTLE